MDNSKKISCWRSSSLKIYASHVLSSWGDRMWMFAVGLYLVVLFPDSLQLTAIFGFLSCISAILFGAFIGKWVDRTERLRAAQVSLITQNTSVIICAVLLIAHLHFKEVSENWNDTAGHVVIVFVIFFGIIANLASVATKLVLEKDWIVVLSGGNESLLSRMNATMRTIDLTTFILAPILVGQIFTYGSHIIGAICIASWNLVSGVVEYSLLIIIYKSMPQLSHKMQPLPTIQIDSPDSNRVAPDPNTPVPEQKISPAGQSGLAFENLSEVSLVTPTSQKIHSDANNHEHRKPTELKGFFRRNGRIVRTKIQETVDGWRDYFSHPVRNAGLGLAFLYMTVLGFDNITTGYAYSQGVSESILGIMTAVGAVFGILGSLSFPFLRKKLGKLVTGNLGFGSETTCLILCLVSIVSPGSPFTYKDELPSLSNEFNCTRNGTARDGSGENFASASVTELWNCNISIILLLIGIVSARFGLWIADLSVVQIFQERVPEHQRGVLNGVQGSLNQLMNLIKFLIVIILPKPDTFAYLIGASWLFVFTGWVFFMVYAWKNRREHHVSSKYTSQILTVSSLVTKAEKESGDSPNSNDNNGNFSTGEAEVEIEPV